MNIETKYKINDEVWFIHPNLLKPSFGKIKGIFIEVMGSPVYEFGERKIMIETGNYKPTLLPATYSLPTYILLIN